MMPLDAHLVHVGQEVLVILDSEQHLLRCLLAILVLSLLLKAVLHALLVVDQDTAGALNESSHVSLRQAVLANALQALIEALVHLRQGVNRGLGAENLKDALNGALPQLAKLCRLWAVCLLVGVQESRDTLGGCNTDRIVEEERQTRQSNLVHNVVDVRLESILQNLSVDDDKLNSHVLVVKNAGLDADNLTLEGYKLPALLVLNLSDLVLVIEQLDVSLGASKFCQWRNNTSQVGHELATHDTAHAAPAVEQEGRLRVIRVGDTVLDTAKQLHQVERILSHPLLSNG